MFSLNRFSLILIFLLATASLATPVPGQKIIVLGSETYHLGRTITDRGVGRVVYRLTDGKVTFTGKVAKPFKIEEQSVWAKEELNSRLVLGNANVIFGQAKINGLGDSLYWIVTTPPNGCPLEECRTFDTLKLKKGPDACKKFLADVARPKYKQAIIKLYKEKGLVHLRPLRANVIWNFEVTEVKCLINFGEMGALGGPEYKEYMKKHFANQANDPADINTFAELNANHWYKDMICAASWNPQA